MPVSNAYLRCPACGLVTTLDAADADGRCYMCDSTPVFVLCADTGREHGPGNLAGVIMFFAARAAREAGDPDAFHKARGEIKARTSAIVHVHAPRPFYCGDCEVIHADSTDCRA